MQIREQQSGARTILELSGRLTVNDQPGMIREAVASAVSRGAREVLLDLAGVNYIDSTRLGELIAAHITMSRQGGALKLVRTPSKIHDLLALAGLDGVFKQYASIEDAN
jgi:anti-sigma B factor antagonist